MSLAKDITKWDGVAFVVAIVVIPAAVCFIVWSMNRVAEACVKSGGTWTKAGECIREAGR